eukprot:6174271-Pleurochrysis_carterae.AAC.3
MPPLPPSPRGTANSAPHWSVRSCGRMCDERARLQCARRAACSPKSQLPQSAHPTRAAPTPEFQQVPARPASHRQSMLLWDLQSTSLPVLTSGLPES